jgi:hypothetical protein
MGFATGSFGKKGGGGGGDGVVGRKKEKRDRRIGRNRGYGGGALGARRITLTLGAIRG